MKTKKEYYQSLVDIVNQCGGTLQTSFGEYNDCDSKVSVSILCKNGHTIDRGAISLSRTGTYSCLKCNRLKTYNDLLSRDQKIALSFEEFCKVNTGDLIPFRCYKGHTEYKKYFVSILRTKRKCPTCRDDKYYENLQNEMKKKQATLTTTRDEYKGSQCTIKGICKYGHDFTQRAYRIMYSSTMCSQCNFYLNEGYTKMILELLTGKLFHKARPKWLINPKTKRILEIDLYNQELNLAVEYNGKQHYKFIEGVHKKESTYKNVLYRDKVKMDTLIKKRVRYIIIPYTQKDNLYEYLLKSLKLFGIDYNIPDTIPDKKDTIKYILPSKDYKYCCRCNIEKKFECFGVDKASKTGYKASCKDCDVKKRYYKKVLLNNKFCWSCNMRKELNEFPDHDSSHCNTCIQNKEKRCSMCKIIKSHDEFNKCSKFLDNRMCRCRKCIHSLIKPPSVEDKFCWSCKVRKELNEFPDKNIAKCVVCTNANTKKCTGCKIIKPLNEFYKKGNKYRPSCKECYYKPKCDDKLCRSCKIRKKLDKFPPGKRDLYCIQCITENVKRCAKCKLIKSRTEFNTCKHNKIGYCSNCRECQRIQRLEIKNKK